MGRRPCNRPVEPPCFCSSPLPCCFVPGRRPARRRRRTGVKPLRVVGKVVVYRLPHLRPARIRQASMQARGRPHRSPAPLKRAPRRGVLAHAPRAPRTRLIRRWSPALSPRRRRRSRRAASAAPRAARLLGGAQRGSDRVMAVGVLAPVRRLEPLQPAAAAEPAPARRLGRDRAGARRGAGQDHGGQLRHALGLLAPDLLLRARRSASSRCTATSRAGAAARSRGTAIRIPDRARPAGGGDAHMTVVDRTRAGSTTSTRCARSPPAAARSSSAGAAARASTATGYGSGATAARLRQPRGDHPRAGARGRATSTTRSSWSSACSSGRAVYPAHGGRGQPLLGRRPARRRWARASSSTCPTRRSTRCRSRLEEDDPARDGALRHVLRRHRQRRLGRSRWSPGATYTSFGFEDALRDVRALGGRAGPRAASTSSTSARASTGARACASCTRAKRAATARRRSPRQAMASSIRPATASQVKRSR